VAVTDTQVRRILKEKSVTILGLGGLGSNVVISLARMGVGTFHLIDYDVIEKSNLNRQYYFLDQIGKKKVDALSDRIRSIDPNITVHTYDVRIDEDNILSLVDGSDIIVEALDQAETKAMVINRLLVSRPEKIVISGSGISGYGHSNEIITRKVQDNYYTIGDGVSPSGTGLGMMAPRVAIAANHQANLVLELLLSEYDSNNW